MRSEDAVLKTVAVVLDDGRTDQSRICGDGGRITAAGVATEGAGAV
jgi:hypothetical protein